MMVVSCDEASLESLSLIQRALPAGMGSVASCHVFAERGSDEVVDQHVDWKRAVLHAFMAVDCVFPYSGD